MKKFVHKVQEIGSKAAQLRDAIQSVPPRVAEVQQAVTGAVGQLQQIRAEVQSTVAALRTDNETSLLEAVREIDGAAGLWREAGYSLEGVEMEVGVPQRLIVHLEKVEDVPHPSIRALAARSAGQPVAHAILTALLKAEALADRVSLAHLQYSRLTVYVGPMPTVRLCWYAEPAPVAATPITTFAGAAPGPAPASAPASFFGSSSFFEPRAPGGVPAPACTEQPPAAPAPAPSAPAPAAPEPAPASDPLARFKKMPNLSRPPR